MREAHGLAEVHAKIAGDVGFGLELFDVVLVGLGEDEPIDVFGVVAVGIAAMFGEFHRKAMEWARVETLQKSFHHKLGAQIQPLDLINDLRL